MNQTNLNDLRIQLILLTFKIINIRRINYPRNKNQKIEKLPLQFIKSKFWFAIYCDRNFYFSRRCIFDWRS